ncbi:MAG: ABC transporter permease [Ignavibacteria bacterium]|nr:ABC transporter permease [Ignavibacteria bacterium]MBK7447099.1 ABC transporter permease [Ignavibacteria bacterium]MBK9405800.1 ABC transporter permease [Ignavibacteria bacterium]MBL0105750.1 ABC transporter permease [Ignavibacteria bacterium]
MNFKFFIAKRYLFSGSDSKFISFITYISILGVTLGVAALIITISILNGFEKEIRDKVSGLVSHIQISSFTPDGLRDYRSAIETIKDSISGVTGISPIVQKEAVIRFKSNVEGILLKGIIIETDLSTARNRILKGEFNLSDIDSTFSRLMIGDKLAKKMNIDTGSKLIVFGLNGIPSPVNPPKIKQFIVSGIYETGLREFDDLIIYTNLKTAQKLFELKDNVTGIEMTLDSIDKVESVVAKIKKDIGYPYYPKSLFKIFKPIFTWVELQKAPTPIILGLIIIVATFNIVGTLLMLVLEKTQSIGTLKSLGAGNGQIMKIFLYDGLIIGITGIILGNILGLGLCFLELKYKLFSLPEIYYLKSVPIQIQPEYVILISLITLILTFIATLIPSYLASRLDPVKSLRFS